MPCVRCGTRARADDLFVCNLCSTDPVKLDEVRQAEKATEGFVGSERERRLEQRRLLVKTFHWFGHWSRR